MRKTRGCIPNYVSDFLEKSYLHTSSLYTDNRRRDAVYGNTWRIYASDYSFTRASWVGEALRVMSWARQEGADARVIEENLPGTMRKCCRGDYIIIVVGEPVAARLEEESLLPPGHFGRAA